MNYENVVMKIDALESKVEGLKMRIDKIFKDEEKLFAFKNNSFEDFDRLLPKLEKFSLLWRKALVFYEIKKQIILNFSNDLEFLAILNQFNEIEKIISNNKAKARKDEEVIVKMSKMLEDDIETLREFILLVYNILAVDVLDDNLRTKIIEMFESKKLEQSFILLIGNILQQKNLSLV